MLDCCDTFRSEKCESANSCCFIHKQWSPVFRRLTAEPLTDRAVRRVWTVCGGLTLGSVSRCGSCGPDKSRSVRSQQRGSFTYITLWVLQTRGADSLTSERTGASTKTETRVQQKTSEVLLTRVFTDTKQKKAIRLCMFKIGSNNNELLCFFGFKKHFSSYRNGFWAAFLYFIRYFGTISRNMWEKELFLFLNCHGGWMDWHTSILAIFSAVMFKNAFI